MLLRLDRLEIALIREHERHRARRKLPAENLSCFQEEWKPESVRQVGAVLDQFHESLRRPWQAAIFLKDYP